MTHFRRPLQQRILNPSSFITIHINKNSYNSHTFRNIVKQQERQFITTINRTVINIDNTNHRNFFSKGNNVEQSSEKKSWYPFNDTAKEPEKMNRLRSSPKNKDQETIQLFTNNDPNFQPNAEQLLHDLNEASKWHEDKNKVDYKFCRSVISDYYQHLLLTQDNAHHDLTIIINPEYIQMALSTLLKAKLHTNNLSNHLRILETTLAKCKILMTDELSFRLLEVHGKAGNIGRCLSLLEFRKKYNFKPRYKEYMYAIQSIISASLPLRTSYPRITNRNNDKTTHPQQKDKYEQYLTEVENPTRYLDAILISMNERNFTLHDNIITKMLSCFSSSGRSSRSLHWFYQTKTYSNKNDDKNDGKKKVQLKFNAPPSSSKLPSSYLLTSNNNIIPSQTLLKDEIHKDKILEASILFAKSLTIKVSNDTPQLSTQSYNALIKSCCHRGAFGHAFDFLYKMKLHNAPNVITYNTILSSLARLGDVTLMHYLLSEMTLVTKTYTTADNTTKTIYPLLDKYTSQAVSDAYLNTSDINGAITQMQSLYKNYKLLPPYTTHYKILEFSLGVGDVYEAKRYVWFLQHVWIDNNFVQKKIGKEELKYLFEYFGVVLEDDDFYVWNSYCENKNRMDGDL